MLPAVRPSSSSEAPCLELLDRCPDVATAQRAHAALLRRGCLNRPHAAGRLVAAYSAHDPARALRLFDRLPTEPDLFSWNVLIRAHASTDPSLALSLFSRLLNETDHRPDNFTFPFAIRAAAGSSSAAAGRAIHGMARKSPLGDDVFVLNALLHFYGAAGCLDDARQLFDRSSNFRDVVSWNTMITTAARAGRCDEALALFREMEEVSTVAPNEITVLAAISACAQSGDLDAGRRIHKLAGDQSLIVNNALLDMYVKCGSINEAKRVFRQMPSKDAVSVTTMLLGLAKAGDLASARKLFEETPHRDLVCWNALISAYEQGGRPDEAMELFRRALTSGVRPDEVTLVAALSACAQKGSLRSGRCIHSYISKTKPRPNCHLTTATIHVYAKCGDLEKALAVFRAAPERNVCVWSAMIAGLGMYGKARAAVDLFEEMRREVRPNGVTFLNLLSACSHGGLVEEGERLFREMQGVHGVQPEMEHYAAMVDLLARARRFRAALDLIEGMPMTPGAAVWAALLGGCSIHGEIALGEEAGDKLLGLEPENQGAYMLLSNLYARSGRWDAVARTRTAMKGRALVKEPGHSAMEVGGILHQFLAGDASQPPLACDEDQVLSLLACDEEQVQKSLFQKL